MGINLPQMGSVARTTTGVTSFAGLDRLLKCQEYEFAAMTNMETKQLPVMSTRPPRRLLRKLQKPNMLAAHDRMCWVDGTDLYCGGRVVGQVEDSRKTFVRMGAQLVIWPDKVLYNVKTDKLESLENKKVTTGTVNFTLCRADGTPYEGYAVGKTAPESPNNGDLWMDTSEEKAALRQYDASLAMWVSIPTVFTMIAAAGIGEGFSKYDGVTVSGCTALPELNGEFFLMGAQKDAVIVTALITQAGSQTEPVTVQRKVPDLDYVCECNNRLWGVKKDVHEIYACALGDPKNWNQFMGLSSDSYVVNVGSAGDFTGAAAHMGSVLMFKEDCVHTVMGTLPSNFTVSVMQCRGVEDGSAGSLKRINEVLYYKSEDHVCGYGSALPSSVSQKLPELGGNAVGGQIGDRYYLCVDAKDGSRELLCYDTQAAAWVREDGLNVQWMATQDGRLYLLAADGSLYCTEPGANEYDGEGAADEEAQPYELVTGPIGLDEPYAKYISRIQLYGETEPGTSLRVEIQYDERGEWERVYDGMPTPRQSMVLPFTTRRCRTLRLRLSGVGGMRLYSIIKNVETGSDHYAAR